MLLIAFFLLLQGEIVVVQADELVSCRYQQATGRNVSLVLEIGSPPPAMLILVQWLPKGMNITRALPPVKKYDPRTGEAKWLLKQLSSGPMQFSIDLDGELSGELIHGEIRYKNPTTGKMEIMAIRP
ncbi:MAG: hypothetical protein OEV73_03820 [Desulfobulbaceae bacterium]|nr:hypothetical protein [Desulfobulbaceae bacterium]